MNLIMKRTAELELTKQIPLWHRLLSPVLPFGGWKEYEKQDAQKVMILSPDISLTLPETGILGA